jgi:hypothetical protein
MRSSVPKSQLQDGPPKKGKSGKTLVGLNGEFLLKLFDEPDHKKRCKMLQPLAVALLWDRGEISDAGMSRAEYAVFLQLTNKIEEKLGHSDLDSIPPEELEALAEKHDLKVTIKAANQMWDDTEVSRKLVREYIAEKKQLRESRSDW